MRYFFLLLSVAFLCSCADEPAKTTSDSTSTLTYITPVKTTRTAIGATGYFIDLPETFKIEPEPQNGEGFQVFYFTPYDTVKDRGEAGIYIGKHPDEQPPSRQYTKKEFSSAWLGQMVKWNEYTTDAYTQRETFVDLGDSTKIHCWCYSDKSEDLEKLFNMINTIGK
jgi:hypothetical protein